SRIAPISENRKPPVRPNSSCPTTTPTTEPRKPIRIVIQIGIGSGPGTASRARPPTMRLLSTMLMSAKSTVTCPYPPARLSTNHGEDRSRGLRLRGDRRDAEGLAEQRRRPCGRAGRDEPDADPVAPRRDRLREAHDRLAALDRAAEIRDGPAARIDRKSTRLNSSHVAIS